MKLAFQINHNPTKAEATESVELAEQLGKIQATPAYRKLFDEYLFKDLPTTLVKQLGQEMDDGKRQMILNHLSLLGLIQAQFDTIKEQAVVGKEHLFFVETNEDIDNVN